MVQHGSKRGRRMIGSCLPQSRFGWSTTTNPRLKTNSLNSGGFLRKQTTENKENNYAAQFRSFRSAGMRRFCHVTKGRDSKEDKRKKSWCEHCKKAWQSTETY